MKIEIEFCIKWNYGPEYDRVSKIITKIRANSTIIGNPIPPRSGAFEVKINNILVFSKLSKNQFPTKNEIISWFE